mmetsp:Transcript_30505/g.98308  ORF Transcript_30505/g.98308 Transcript_30505/m.98308 type:complete len:247 (-) Transcript_30505:176-916(-)
MQFRPTVGELKQEAQLGALESALHAAVRDYKAELTADEQKAKAKEKAFNEQEVDLLDDDDLDSLHMQRLQELKLEAQRRDEQKRLGHGQYRLVAEPEFLKEVTGSENVVCHFFCDDFIRCKIVDKHLGAIARKYVEAKFIRVSAPDAPFFVQKLKIKVLPCIVMFKGGIAIDRVVGFEELGGVDDFEQIKLEKRLASKAMIQYKNDDSSDDEEDEVKQKSKIRGGALYSGSKYSKKYSGDDSDEEW